MRTPFYYDNAQFINAFRQKGSGFNVYSGSRRFRGGSILGTTFKFLARYGLPVLKKIIGPARNIVSRALEDVRTNKTPFKQAISTSARKELFGSGHKRKRSSKKLSTKNKKVKKQKKKPKKRGYYSKAQVFM